jgi:hypothetical protein
MSDSARRSPRWMPATGDYSERQLHAMEFIASSLDLIDGHLETIAASIAGSGPHKPFGEALGDQLRALGEAISRLGRPPGLQSDRSPDTGSTNAHGP